MNESIQTFPYPADLDAAVAELRYLPGWRFRLADEDRGQGCSGLTLSVWPDKPDSYHPKRPVNTRFVYPVPAAAFNRESWEEWLWARIEETEAHERAEWFRFATGWSEPEDECGDCGHQATVHDGRHSSCRDCPVERPGHRFSAKEERYRRPFKPAHPDGWDPGVVRSVVSESVVNTPNAGRLVTFPCRACGHDHRGKMGEHFRIEADRGCVDVECPCGKTVGARMPTGSTGEAEIFINDLRFVVAPGVYSGLDIRHFMHPPLADGWFLYVEGQEDELVLVRKTDELALTDGYRFRVRQANEDS